MRAWVVMGDEPLPETSLSPVYRYEDLLAAKSDAHDWPQIDEGRAAGMCYTSGTTGHPKGVVYSHRALVLQCFAQCMTDAFGLRESDVILSVVPMFHANAWGLPFSGTMVGATQVYPGVQPTPRDDSRNPGGQRHQQGKPDRAALQGAFGAALAEALRKR